MSSHSENVMFNGPDWEILEEGRRWKAKIEDAKVTFPQISESHIHLYKKDTLIVKEENPWIGGGKFIFKCSPGGLKKIESWPHFYFE